MTEKRPSIGVVGAGQLARMLYESATPLDVDLTVLATNSDESAARIAPKVQIGSPDSIEALRLLSNEVDVLTFDHELVDTENLLEIEREGTVCRPGSAVLSLAQNKLLQCQAFTDAGLPIPEFVTIQTASEVSKFADQHGWPVALKTVRGGYDGRGVWIVDSEDEAEQIVKETANSGLKLIAERAVKIDRELSIQVARRPGGEMVAYPVVESVQVDGICTETVTPAPLAPQLAERAKLIGLAIAEKFDVVGMLAVELFEESGELLVNEIATRPHNSGHYSIEGSLTSQFENHIRAVLDLPLGSTALVAPVVAMVNILGADNQPSGDALKQALHIEGLHVHLYGKEFRPGRKLGHVTVLGGEREAALTSARLGAALLSGETVLTT